MSGPARPVGVFDSGLGGLTVVRELLRALPRERVVYLGDTARVPYGNKSAETIRRFSRENVLFLLKHRVKMVVVACHSSSSLALAYLTRRFRVPVLGVVEPGVEAAVRATRAGRIGVIGTQATVESGAYGKAIARRDKRLKVVQAACPLFVPLAEEGWMNEPAAQVIARRYLRPLVRARVDTLILGCTHYPLLKQVIGRAMGPKVRLIDPGAETALRARTALERLDLAVSGRMGTRPVHRFFVTDKPRHFETLSRRFLGTSVARVTRA